MSEIIDKTRITLPGDMEFENGDWLDKMVDIAIDTAREELTLWYSHCGWGAELVDGEEGDWEVTFEVTRYSLVDEYDYGSGGKRPYFRFGVESDGHSD